MNRTLLPRSGPDRRRAVHGLLLAGSLLVSLILAEAAAAAGPSTVAKTTSCLEAHHVIVNPLPAKENPVPRRFRGIGVLAISFALVHGQELDAATLTFEKDPATARRVLVAFKAWALERAKQLKDTAAPTLLPKLVGVIGNVIVFWDDPSVKSASRRTLANCLRA